MAVISEIQPEVVVTPDKVRYKRLKGMSISNALNKAPVMSLYDEYAYTDGTVEPIRDEPLQVIYVPGVAIQLVDPATGTLTGQSVTHEHVMQIVYSIYAQALQDAASANV